MPENVKKCAENAAKVLNSTAPGKRDMAFVIAETFATGLAIGADLKKEKKRRSNQWQGKNPFTGKI